MSLEVGNKVEGKITGLARFGAFVDLGDNKTGLVHISEVSDKFVEDINDELKVGQVITVEILSIADDGKIALSMRDREKEAEEKKSGASSDKKKDFSRSSRPSSSRGPSKPFQPKRQSSGGSDFDSMMSDFLKDSESRLSSIKKNTENRRGGGGRN